MKKRKIFLAAACVALPFLFALIVPQAAWAVTYNAESQFSSTQGSNYWYYQEHTGTVYQNMTWNAGGWWQGTYAYCQLGNNWGHPQVYKSARKWLVPSAGKVRITGSAYDQDTGGGDGVIVRIYKNTILLWYATINNGDTTGYTYDLSTGVAAGDAIYFVIDQRSDSGWDRTYFNPTIEHTSGTDADMLRPYGATLGGTNSASYASGVYTFNYSKSGDDTRQYKVDINNTNVQKGLVRIYENYSASYPIHYGGTRYRKLNGTLMWPSEFANAATVTMLSHSLSGLKLTIRYRDVYEGVTNEKTITYEIKNKTMIISVFANTDRVTANGNYAGFVFDRSENTTNARSVGIPFMSATPIVVVNNSFFYSTYLDMGMSSGTKFLISGPTQYSATSFYCSNYSECTANSAGEVMPINETAYLTVSSKVEDVMPAPNHAASAYRSNLNSKVVLDFWWNSFDYNRGKMNTLYSYGLTDILVLYHQWQYYGYDVGMPKHYPAGSSYGGPTAFTNLVNQARTYGYLFAAHEDYWMMDSVTTYPYWNAANVAREPNLTYRTSWYDPYLGRWQYALASDKMKYYSQLESTQIKNNYNTNAAFLDVNPGWDPETDLHQIDYNAANPNSRSLGHAIHHNKILFNYMRGVYSGPLLGEGGSTSSRHDSFYAGYVDGVEREIEGDEDAAIIPDFELKMIKPLMANHGNGYLERYFSNFSGTVTLDMLDKYRATEIAHGHAGFTQPQYFYSNQLAKVCQEYYMMKTLQAQFLANSVTTIQYRNTAGTMVDLSAAIKNGIYGTDFKNAQLYIQYSNGLQIYVNHHDTENWSVTAGGTGYTLPPHGWVAWNTNYLNYSALISGGGGTAYTASTDFSSTQGYRNWYYQQYTGSVYQNMTWDSGNSLWKGSYEYCRLWGDGGHPQTYESARKWVSPAADTLTITGNAHDNDGGGGNGVIVSIYKNTTLLWSATIANGDTTGYNYNLNVNVAAGDAIYFRIHQNGADYSYDNTYFNPTITTGGSLRRVDYVNCSEYVMANGRGVSTNFGNITTTYFKVIKGALTVTENADGSLTIS